jgi:hypothetical protein
MHFHLPKPLHGWREFAGEVGIIVLGVLIALGVEQIAQAVHDAASKREAQQTVYAEIRQNLSYMTARMVTQPCVERRLDEIATLLARAGDGALSPQPKWIGQPAIWFNSDERWQAATGSGRASLFSPDEQSRLGSVYVATKQFIAAEEREQDAWAQLRGLESWTGPLGQRAVCTSSPRFRRRGSNYGRPALMPKSLSIGRRRLASVTSALR